jgi:hypothetical protein
MSKSIPVADHIAANTNGTSAMSVNLVNNVIHGYCSLCERAVPVRITRRCNRCHSEDIDIPSTLANNNWNELNGQYTGFEHNRMTRCDNKRWEFVGICQRHPNKMPDRHCPLLPGVIANVNGLPCGGCGKVEPVVLRFGCNHFICIPKCWRNYARAKLDVRELFFDTPTKGCDATLPCPGNLKATSSFSDIH